MQFDGIGLGLRAGDLADDAKPEPFLWLNLHGQNIRLERGVRVGVEQDLGDRLEEDRDLAGPLGHTLAGSQVERHAGPPPVDRKSTRLNSSHVSIAYAVFCLKKKETT